ncbi:MAG: hypothetical protein ACI9IP_002926 [Arcticibacterium sp.]|jgi:hypothetical protein
MDAKSGAIQFFDKDKKRFPDEGSISISPDGAIPFQLIKSVQILHNKMPTEAITESETLEIEFREGNISLGVVELEVETVVEDINFDINVGIQNTLNQTAEVFKFKAISSLNAISKFFGFEHVVGGDGCPMPLFEVTGLLNNSVPTDVLKRLCYTFTGINQVDAYNVNYPENSIVREIEMDMQVYDCHKLNEQNELQAFLNFNCIRAADVRAEPHLNVFFFGPPNMDINVFDSVFEFETKMR